MVSRGERFFANAPRFTGSVYDHLTQMKAWTSMYKEIAQDLVLRISRGRLLDIGTGPARLLLEIHRLNPDVELFGLDISDSMVQRAKKNLQDIRVDLRQGNIRETDYASDFFDLVTSMGSFYLWDNPERCLEEIHRILQRNQSAYLFETHTDFDAEDFQRGVRANLRSESLFRKLAMPFFLRKAVKMAYRIDVIAEIIRRTSFANSFTMEKITLSGLPIWLRIQLTKN